MDVEPSELIDREVELPNTDLAPGVERWCGDLKFVGAISLDAQVRSNLGEWQSSLSKIIARQRLLIVLSLVIPIAGTVLAATTSEGAWMISLLALILGGRVYLYGEYRLRNATLRRISILLNAPSMELYEHTIREIERDSKTETEEPSIQETLVPETMKFLGLSDAEILLIVEGEEMWVEQAEFYEVRPSIPLYETVRPWRIEELTKAGLFENRQLSDSEKRDLAKWLWLSLFVPGLLVIGSLIYMVIFDFPIAMKLGPEFEMDKASSPFPFLILFFASIRLGVKWSGMIEIFQDHGKGNVCRRFEDGVTLEWLPKSLRAWSIDDEPVDWWRRTPFLL